MSAISRDDQIRQAHATFICKLVELAGRASAADELDELLRSAEEQGWTRLVGALRQILGGRRDSGALQGLDDEDRVIAEAVLLGLQDPGTLPDPRSKPDPTLAAPGLAQLIHEAGSGNAQALTIISQMAEQMSRAGGGMARLAAVIRPLVNGERDPDRLCRNMDARGQQLALQILDELGKLQLH